MKFAVTISRSSDDKIRIRFRDRLSGAEFVEACLSPGDFAMAITGLGEVDAEGEVRLLDAVGKRRVRERRSAVVPEHMKYNRNAIREWLKSEKQEAGWFLASFVGSQDSISRNQEGQTVVNYSVYKFVESSE